MVTESNNLQPLRALLETLLNYESHVLKTRDKCDRYEEDIPLDDLNRTTTGTNTGLKALEVKFKESNVVRLSGRLYSELLHQEKQILPGVKLHVLLVLAPPAFFMKTSASDGDTQVLHK